MNIFRFIYFKFVFLQEFSERDKTKPANNPYCLFILNLLRNFRFGTVFLGIRCYA